MSPYGHKHGGERELVHAVLLDGESAGPGLHARRHDAALVVGHQGPVPVGRCPVAGEGGRMFWNYYRIVFFDTMLIHKYMKYMFLKTFTNNRSITVVS